MAVAWSLKCTTYPVRLVVKHLFRVRIRYVGFFFGPPEARAGPGTYTNSYFRRGTACLRAHCSVHSHFKKIKNNTKMFLGILRFYLCKKNICL